MERDLAEIAILEYLDKADSSDMMHHIDYYNIFLGIKDKTGIKRSDLYDITEGMFKRGWLEAYENTEESGLFRISAKGQIKLQRASASSNDLSPASTAHNRAFSGKTIMSETGDSLLTESGDHIVTESNGEYSLTDRPIIVNSTSWTGLTKTVIDARNVNVISRQIEQAIDAISGAGAGNFETMQATAFLRAAKELVDAPEPPSQLIWQLISKAADVVGLFGLFFTLFSQSAS